jgi:hypothetical protein
MFSVIFASEDTPGQEEFPDQGSPKSEKRPWSFEWGGAKDGAR